MAFLDNLTSPVSPHEAALATGVAALSLSGPFTELERRLISIFRDEFPPLSKLSDTVFNQITDRSVDMIQRQGAAADVHKFVRQYVAPAIVSMPDRVAVYKFAFTLGIANLNIDSGEQALLDALKSDLNLNPNDTQVAETDVYNTYAPLHRALAATALGFIVLAADGVVRPEELTDIKASRKVLDPIARMDDTQFALIYDLGVSVYNRFLTDPNNRRVFLYQIITPSFSTADLRIQAFHYAASVATADGDLARAEIDTLKDILTALQMADADGERIFAEYMSRVKTIDGRPNAPVPPQ